MEKLKDLDTKKLRRVCQKFGVKELYLFGSAVSGNLSSDSDLDLIVGFDRDEYSGAFDRYLDFKKQLEQLYGRPVDLYTQKKFRNSIFQKEVDRTKELIYAAEDKKTA